MAKAAKKKRAEQYEPKVKFEGSFEDMIAISLTGAGAPNKNTKKKNNMAENIQTGDILITNGTGVKMKVGVITNGIAEIEYEDGKKDKIPVHALAATTEKE